MTGALTTALELLLPNPAFKVPKLLKKPKVQQTTAGDELSVPKASNNVAVVMFPPEMTKELENGFPTYSPNPKPAVLLVTITLIAA